ncbi:MAG: tail fiber domain-containing protein, partial [Gammaproteobacteria bacterium]|nr:tail fiber domain-containing protein [Gammaproteobacteria bacterium]
TGFAVKAQSVGYDGLKSNADIYMTYKPNDTACTDNQIMTWDAANTRWICGDINIAAETDPTVAESVKDGVSWSEVTEMPADFADGTDDGVTSESDPTVAESVKDGVSWSEVTGMPAGFSDGTDDGITSESDPTVDPSVKDGVSWTEVSEIPAGFADGVDNTGDTDWAVSGNNMNSTVTGRVGIGITSPSLAKLHVSGGDRGVYGVATAGSSAIRPFGMVADVITKSTTTTGGGFLAQLSTSNTPNVEYVYGGIFSVNDDGDKKVRGLTIDVNSTESNDYGLEIIVSNPGYAIHSGESGKIYFNGNVGIGTFSPAYRLEIEGGDVNVTAGSYRAKGLCVAGACVSDRNLKKNIVPLSSSLDKLTQLEPVNFEFIDPKYGSGRQDGLIAQDVEEVFPEWVNDSEEGYKAIKYGLQIQMYLIQALKELKIENDNLKARILALENTL